MPTPEDRARENVDRLLTQAGWAVRGQSDANISAYRGLVRRNLTSKQSYGFADYLLYVDGRAAGVIEPKTDGGYTHRLRDPVRDATKSIIDPKILTRERNLPSKSR